MALVGFVSPLETFSSGVVYFSFRTPLSFLSFCEVYYLRFNLGAVGFSNFLILTEEVLKGECECRHMARGKLSFPLLPFSFVFA